MERHEQQEIETVFRRFADLSARAQVEAFGRIRAYLDGGIEETKTEIEMARRKGALEALQRVAEELGLPDGQAPTTTQFREGARQLGLDWSVSKVGRAWGGKWRFACEAYVGHRLRRSSSQQAMLDAEGKRRAFEGYLTCVRLWLETSPALETVVAYDRWAVAFNEALPRNQLPVVRWTTINNHLRVSLHDAIRVARGEVELAACQTTRNGHAKEYGPLASKQWIAGEYGLTPHQAANVPRRPEFPKPVVMLSGTRCWWKDDVRAYFEGRHVQKRVEEFELQAEYLSLAEVAALMGKRPRMISQTTRMPESAGLVGKKRYWERAEVERWVAANAERSRTTRAGATARA